MTLPRTTTPRLSGGPTGRPLPGHWAWLQPADWCDDGPGILPYVCETYVVSPVWSSVIVVDAVGLWLIAAMLRRQWEQDREVKARRTSLPKEQRVRRDWGAMRVASRLASLGAGKGELRQGEWVRSWQRVVAARAQRKIYLHKSEYNLGGVLTRACGPLMVAFVSCLVLYETHAFYTLALPWLGVGGVLGKVFGCCMGVIPVRIFLDYARTCLTDPGTPCAEGNGAVVVANATPYGDMELGKSGAPTHREPRRCRPCGGPKPARCHHCKVCRRCVLKMDHHCPFVNNCVGLRNHRFFCFFLLDLVVGCLVVSSALAPQIPEVIFPHRYNLKMSFAHRFHVASACFIAFMAQASVGPFFLFHLQLILMNETTLEFMSRRSRGRGKAAVESYSRGALENFAEVCGAPPTCFQRRFGSALERLVPPHVSRLAKRSA